MRNTILILEDDTGRLKRLLATIAREHPQFRTLVWSDAHAMNRELHQHLPSAALICLDHDLYAAEESAPDPGDGLDVAKRLADLEACCPVLIHSSNTDRANTMFGELDSAGWVCRRVAPLGSYWVESDWAVVVRELLSGGPTNHSS